MIDETKSKKLYDLEERTFKFARSVIDFIDTLPRTIVNTEIAKQVIRSSGSVGANYIEANEALSKKTTPSGLKFAEKKPKKLFTGLSS